MSKYRVELGDQHDDWMIVTTGSDGIVDIVAEFVDHEQAVEECRLMNQDYENAMFHERRYQEMYAYACGYYD